MRTKPTYGAWTAPASAPSSRVATEVSELSGEGAIQMGGISIPALKVRRASSTVELPSGGSLVLGGLLQEQTRQNINGVPGLMNIPILGTLFRSRDYQTGQLLRPR